MPDILRDLCARRSTTVLQQGLADVLTALCQTDADLRLLSRPRPAEGERDIISRKISEVIKKPALNKKIEGMQAQLKQMALEILEAEATHRRNRVQVLLQELRTREEFLTVDNEKPAGDAKC